MVRNTSLIQLLKIDPVVLVVTELDGDSFLLVLPFISIPSAL
jgi:hypothetical protein